MKTCLASTANQFAFTSGKSGRSPLHRAAAYPLQQPRGNSRAVLSFLIGNHYRIVIIGKTNFFGATICLSRTEKWIVKTTKAVLAAMVGIGPACSAAAQLKEQPGEAVELKSLPASVQNTINQKAAGGEVVQVRREDDSNGKWNYEVVVRTNGKESGFEVDPNGKFLRIKR